MDMSKTGAPLTLDPKFSAFFNPSNEAGMQKPASLIAVQDHIAAPRRSDGSIAIISDNRFHGRCIKRKSSVGKDPSVAICGQVAREAWRILRLRAVVIDRKLSTAVRNEDRIGDRDFCDLILAARSFHMRA
jgi:hypothetical protein